eukprot:126534-Prymnesium_polylepis.1
MLSTWSRANRLTLSPLLPVRRGEARSRMSVGGRDGCELPLRSITVAIEDADEGVSVSGPERVEGGACILIDIVLVLLVAIPARLDAMAREGANQLFRNRRSRILDCVHLLAAHGVGC